MFQNRKSKFIQSLQRGSFFFFFPFYIKINPLLLAWRQREMGVKETWRVRSVCLVKQGQPLVRCPSFIDNGSGKMRGKKLMKLSAFLNKWWMGIRKGWALSGAREKRCFISHAVSSHPLLELQTPGLSSLSPQHQDLPLDSVQKRKISPDCLFFYCSFFLFLFFFFVFPITSSSTFPPHPWCW